MTYLDDIVIQIERKTSIYSRFSDMCPCGIIIGLLDTPANYRIGRHVFTRYLHAGVHRTPLDLQVQALTVLADKLTGSNNNFRMFPAGRKYVQL